MVESDARKSAASSDAKPRLVVKIGSSLLASSDHLTPRYAFMHGLLSDIKLLVDQGYEVVLTSSGSVALGLNAVSATIDAATIQDKQAAAACGQPILMHAYKQVALEHGFDIAQVLVTLEDLEDRRRFLNTKSTIQRLIERGVMPIVNENDTVTTEEIRVGDNDRLAAKIAQMIQAEYLFILTCVDGVYDRDPAEPGAVLVETINDVSKYLEAASGTSSLGTGGMFTKLQAANMAQNAGCTTIIASGELDAPISALIKGERRHTRCIPQTSSSSSWAIWLTDRLQMAGGLVVRQAVADKLSDTSDVSRQDIVSTYGTFQRADVLHIYDEKGVELARGMSNFSSDEASLIADRLEEPVEDLLGYNASSCIINTTNLVMLEEHHLNWEPPDDDSPQEELYAENLPE